MAEKDRQILAAMIKAFTELESLCGSVTRDFQQEIERVSGLSFARLKEYKESLQGLQTPLHGKKLFTTLPESEQAPLNACPHCAGSLETFTNLEPASQRGCVMVVTLYRCGVCGYQDQDRVSLPTEIALQQQNLEAFMKGM